MGVAPPTQMTFDFHLSFGGKLRRDNRWVILSQQIPWYQIESQYAVLFQGSNVGCPAKFSRVALGALIIKERLATTDRETVEQISENPYLQYFLGFAGYTDKEPFHHTSMVHFRKRFHKETLAQINELIVHKALQNKQEQCEDVSDDTSQDNTPPSNRETCRAKLNPIVLVTASIQNLFMPTRSIALVTIDVIARSMVFALAGHLWVGRSN
jgi:hypothetical protein